MLCHLGLSTGFSFEVIGGGLCSVTALASLLLWLVALAPRVALGFEQLPKEGFLLPRPARR